MAIIERPNKNDYSNFEVIRDEEFKNTDLSDLECLDLTEAEKIGSYAFASCKIKGDVVFGYDWSNREECNGCCCHAYDTIEYYEECKGVGVEKDGHCFINVTYSDRIDWMKYSIHNGAFANNPDLKSFRFLSKTPPSFEPSQRTLSIGSYSNIKYPTIYVPSDAVDAYKQALYNAKMLDAVEKVEGY